MSKAKKIVENLKFEYIDILDMMGRIVKAHTEHCASDFDIDRKVLWSASTKEERQDRIYVWLCRKSGTWLLRERDVYISDTRENATFRYYLEQRADAVLAFIVEVTGYTINTVIGHLYTVDYSKYYSRVMEKVLPAKSIILSYEGGSRTLEAGASFNAYPDCKYGKFLSFECQPDSPEKLKETLWDERYCRDHFDDGNVEEYLTGLESREKQVI